MSRLRFRTAVILLGASVLAPSLNGRVSAFNYVMDANGTWWGIQDAAPPRVDTGSIRATQVAPGIMPDGVTAQPYSTAINGFGGIKVRVQTSPAPRFNGELMRGFGLRFDGSDRFTTTQSIDLGGVLISRAVYVNRRANWGRWVDSFTNTTKRPMTINVAFGGQSGVGTGATGTNNQPGNVVNTSSGDAIVTAADAWVTVASPLSGVGVAPPFNDPQVTVLGTPSTPAQPFSGALTFAGNWLHDTFSNPLVYTGHEGNFQAYINTLTIAPRTTRSLLHFVVLGARVTETTSPGVRASLEATANMLAEAPDTGGLTTADVCSIANFSRDALAAGGFRTESCRNAGRVNQAAAPRGVNAVTNARYDVVGKTIAQLREDMEAGRTTSQEITRAYLDRIAVYDQGQWGFNAYEYVAAREALAQARAADAARRAGRRGPLLGIPIAVKNLFDTHDMPTTNGSMTFKGFLPARDAFQVARLREAGAVILGKTALEEYATTGGYSNDAWGQVWNVFNPSKSAIASSGGSAVAVAGSMAAAALGSQTGDSLYGPASAASLVTLRGTDGLESGTGVMPLVWLTDFGGAMTRSVSDLADMLNVLAVVDPEDPETSAPGRRTPADWRAVLDVNALRGKRIGYIASAWVDPLGTTGTIDASKAALRYFEEAGATIVEMGVTVGGTDLPPAPAAPPGDVRSEGWRQYIDTHPELAQQGFQIFTAVDVNCSQKKVAYVRADPASPGCQPAAASPRLTAAEIQAFRDYRRGRQATAKIWMDTGGADRLGVDAVVYPGLLSDISLNDGGGSKASFGRRDTPSAANGIPTIVFPAGHDSHGQPIGLQLLGRAWDDDRLVAMAYAFEHYAEAAGSGHIEPRTVPPLRHRRLFSALRP